MVTFWILVTLNRNVVIIYIFYTIYSLKIAYLRVKFVKTPI